MKILLLILVCFSFSCTTRSDLICLSICKEKFPEYKLHKDIVKYVYLMDKKATVCFCPLILPLSTQCPGSRAEVEQNNKMGVKN